MLYSKDYSFAEQIANNFSEFNNEANYFACLISAENRQSQRTHWATQLLA